MDYIDLGSNPTNEDCYQVGKHSYDLMRKEAAAYREGLRKKYGNEPNGVIIKIKCNSHDFGPYSSVVVYFNPNIKEHVDYAYSLENGFETWESVGLKRPE